MGPAAQPAGTRRWRRVLAVAKLALTAAVLAISWPTSLGGQVSYVQVTGQSMEPTYLSGDLVVTREAPSYRAGDPVVYRIPKGEVGAGAQVVHRIIGGNGRDGFFLRGDNNSHDDSWHPTHEDVVGRVVLHLPDAGNWLAFLVRPINLGILCGTLTLTSMLWPRRERSARRRKAGDDEVSAEERPAGDEAPDGGATWRAEEGQSRTVFGRDMAEADPALVPHPESLV